MRIHILFATALLLGNAITVKGQDDKKEKVPVFNYTIDDPMDAFGKKPITETVVYPVAFPEFFSFKPRVVKDTTYTYECYTIYNDPVFLDSLKDIEGVRYISVIKTYADPANIYVDAKGNKKPLPIKTIINRYDKIGSNRWLSVDYISNKQTYLAEFKNYTSRTDTTTSTDPTTGVTTNVIHKYYKVFPEKAQETNSKKK